MEVLFTVMGTPRSVELPMLSISSLSEKLNSTESENRMINGNVVLLSNTRKRVGFFDVLLSQKSKESSSVRAHECSCVRTSLAKIGNTDHKKWFVAECFS